MPFVPWIGKATLSHWLQERNLSLLILLHTIGRSLATSAAASGSSGLRWAFGQASLLLPVTAILKASVPPYFCYAPTDTEIRQTSRAMVK